MGLVSMDYRHATTEVLTELVVDFSVQFRSLVQAHTAAICEVAIESRTEDRLSSNRRTIMEQEADLNLLDQRVKLARSKLKVAQRELDQYQNKGAPLPLPVATANSKQEIAQAITGLVESATDVQSATRALRRIQSDNAMLRGELSGGSWSQQLHHLTPLCIPDDGLLQLLRDCKLPIEIVDTGRIVTGMKLWAVEEWLFSSTRSQACVLQQSEDIADTVEVDVIRLREDATPEHNKLLWWLLGETVLSGGWLEETEFGAMAVVGVDANPPAGLTLTIIPDGRMRAHQQSLCQQLALKRMSCGLSSLSAGELSSGCRVVFRSLYGVPAQDELAVSISNVLNEVECMLALLGNLPWSAGAEQQRANSDYRFSDVLVAALCAFQVDSNSAQSFSSTLSRSSTSAALLREDGHLDPNTLFAMRNRYSQCEQALRTVRGVALGFTATDKLKHNDGIQVRHELSMYQERLNLPAVTGSFNGETLDALGVGILPVGTAAISSSSTVAAIAQTSHRKELFGDSELSATLGVTQAATQAERDSAFPKGWTNHATSQQATPGDPSALSPMQQMDACTPLSPRTRLFLGIVDPEDSFVSSTPNELFGSHVMDDASSPDHPVKRSLKFGEMAAPQVSGRASQQSLPEQLSSLQIQLEQQKARADDAATQAAQANAETQALRAVVTTLQSQINGLPEGGRGAIATSAPAAPNNPGMLILDVLGVLWLKDAVQGVLGK